MNAPPFVRERTTFVGSHMSDVPIIGYPPQPGGTGVHVGVCVTRNFPDHIMSLRIQGGDQVLIGAAMTISQALDLAGQLVKHATTAVQAQAEAEQDATAPGGAG